MNQFPNGWSYESIDSIVQGGMIADGDWVESKDQDPNGKVRLTQLADVGDGEFRSRSDRWMNDEQASRLNVNYLQPGDLLMARMPDPLGRTCMVPENIGRAVTVVDVAIIRITRKDVNPKFVMWLLNSPGIRQQIEMLASGTTRRRITRKNLGTIDLPMPPFDEQNKIVDFLEDHLSRLDSALTVVKQAKLKAAQFRRSLLQAAFTGDLSGDGTRLMNHSFDDVFTVGKTARKAVKHKDYIPEGKFPVIDQGEDFISGYSNDESLVLDFAKPVIIFGDHTRRLKYVKFPFIPGADGTKILIQSDSMDSKFAYYQLLSKDLRDRGYARHFSELRKEEFWVPSIHEQHKIVELLEDHLSRLEASVSLADAMEKQSNFLRRSLLQAAFTGQLTKEVVSV